MMFFIASTFVKSLSTLTSQDRKSAERAAFALQLNPANPGFSYERLNNPKDPCFWSARVNDNIRVIVHRDADRFTLCYVGNHDEAYRWAERRRYDVHPTTGAAQFVEIVEREEKIVRRVVQREVVSRPFQNLGRDYLLALGVPQTWLDAVVGGTENNLLEVLSHLPEEAADRLLDIAIGNSPSIPQAAATDPDKVIAESLPEPFLHPDAQRRFRIVKNENELKQSLEGKWSRGSLVPDRRGVERGIRLFKYLVEAVNLGRTLGISYGGFIAHLHGVAGFDELTGRNYLPSDTGAIVRIALSITEEAGGRREITRSEHTIRAGMDTFIWQKRRPFDRSPLAWKNYPVQPPYDRAEWLRIFPEGSRNLITPSEILRIEVNTPHTIP